MYNILPIELPALIGKNESLEIIVISKYELQAFERFDERLTSVTLNLLC